MRRVDAMVAEKVMGWVRHPRNTAHWVEGGRDPFMAPVKGFVPECGMGAWSPSTSIAAAWAVVEKMRADGFRFSFTEPFGTRTAKFAANNDNATPYGYGVVDGPVNTDACAICLAALRAKNVPESEIAAAMEGER